MTYKYSRDKYVGFGYYGDYYEEIDQSPREGTMGSNKGAYIALSVNKEEIEEANEKPTTVSGNLKIMWEEATSSSADEEEEEEFYFPEFKATLPTNAGIYTEKNVHQNFPSSPKSYAPSLAWWVILLIVLFALIIVTIISLVLFYFVFNKASNASEQV